MKTTPTRLLLALGLTAGAFTLTAAPGEGAGRPDGPQGHRPPPPIIAVLDADKDGTLSAAEIAQASASLLSLDKNGDGVLTKDEMFPPRPEGGPRGEGPRGEGRRAGPPES